MKYQKREREKMAIVVSRSFFFEYSCSDLCTFSFSLLLYPPPIRTRAFSSSLSRSVLLAPFLTDSRTRRRSLIVFFFFFLPFFLSFFFTVRSKVTPRTKFDESKCARLARLDYYTRREAALCQALNHVRGWKIKVGARVRRLKVDRLFGAIELSIATKG